jgi:hypothetical protein
VEIARPAVAPVMRPRLDAAVAVAAHAMVVDEANRPGRNNVRSTRLLRRMP